MSMPRSSEYDLLDRLAEEFAERYRRGERPALQEYVDRHPELADHIRKLFPALVQVERAEDDHHESAGPADDASGPQHRQVGDYHILREIGRGGMGVVYEAEQVSLARRVALKVLPRQVEKGGQAHARFRREARSAAKLHHTNIVPVFEVGHQSEIAYYAMQFIDGPGLDLVITELRRLRAESSRADRSGPGPASPLAVTRSRQPSMAARSLLTGQFEPQDVEGVTTPRSEDGSWSEGFAPSDPGATNEAADTGTTDSAVLPGGVQVSTAEAGHRHPYYRSVARIGQQTATALAHAHARGIVHRDIKPSNLLLDSDGMVWITDFGLAKSEDDALTNTGDILGTLRYMAPERFRGEGDGRADLYALGLTLYELLTLQPAFDSSDRLQLIEQVKNMEPGRPRAVDSLIPRDLETIVLKSIDKDPRRRYQSAEEMAEDLRRFIAGEPIQARRVGLWERAALWARRRPAEAALAAVGSLATLALIGMAVSLWYGGLLKQERDRARKFQYFQHIALANTAWRDGNMGRLEQLLDECPVEHKGHWEWRYLKRQCHREYRRFVGHDGAVFQVKYSRDGKRLVSGSLDGTVRLWDTETGQLLRTYVGHANSVVGVAFSPVDDNQIASSSWDGTVRIWDATTGRLVGAPRNQVPGVHNWDVVYSPDGASLALAGSDGMVRILNLASGEHEDWKGGHTLAVRRVAYSPDGKWLASTGADRMTYLWDTTTGQVHWSFPGHEDMVLGVAFSPDGTCLATASFDRTVRIWDVATGQSVGTLQGHEGAVWAVAFSPDGNLLASSSADPNVKVWDWRSRKELLTIRGHGGAVHDVAFSRAGTQLATASHDMTIKFWDLSETIESRVLSGHVGPVNGVAFHPVERIVASAGQDKTIRLWDVITGQMTCPPLEGHEAAALCVAFSPIDETIASGDKKGIVRLWDRVTRKSRALADDHGGEVASIAFRPDGKHLATAGKDGKVRIWLLNTLEKIDEYRSHLRSVTTLAYSPNGRFLASGGEDRTVVVRGETGSRVIASKEDHSCWVHGVAYSPSGRYLSTATGIDPEDPATSRLVSASGDGTLSIWDATTGRKLLPIKAHGGDTWGIAFSPDGTRLASGSIDRTVKLWDVVSGDEVLTLRGHAGGVLYVAFSPDGNLLASAGRDGTVRIWDATPWAPTYGR